MKLDTRKTVLAAALIFFVTAIRVVEHPFNATPMVAVMLFAATVFKEWRWKIGVPFAALLISDALIEAKNGYGFHSSTVLVYATFALIFALGFVLLKKVNPLRVIGSSLAASVVFFLVTNFAFFYPEATVADGNIGNYPHNLVGIIASYQAGLPFFKNMLVGDLLFSGLLFVSYSLVGRASWFSPQTEAK